MTESSLPLRFDLQVGANGRVEFAVPLPAGSQVAVFVAEPAQAELLDLVAASASSTEFWDNPYDDEDWNDA